VSSPYWVWRNSVVDAVKPWRCSTVINRGQWCFRSCEYKWLPIDTLSSITLAVEIHVSLLFIEKSNKKIYTDYFFFQLPLPAFVFYIRYRYHTLPLSYVTAIIPEARLTLVDMCPRLLMDLPFVINRLFIDSYYKSNTHVIHVQ
jgi:hypothetical protein